MGKETHIPTLTIDEISRFHKRSISWLPIVSNTKHKNYHINKLEDISDKSKFQVLPHRKTFHDFFYLSKGKSIRSKGLDSYEITAPSIFILPAYQITEHKMISEDAEGFYCHFDEHIFNNLPNKYLSEHYSFFQFQSSPVIPLNPESQKNIAALLERLFYLYRKTETYNESLVSLYLLTLFEELKSDIPSAPNKGKNSYFLITKKFKQALTEHIYDHQQIADYADMLNVTPNYLNKCVKTATDKTAQELLKEMLILEAKTLIKHSNLNVSEIAVKLCNQTPSNFARFFRKQTGMTPKQYSQKN
ncbi:helix-turn-helix domain-containing protein [Maribacter sp. CXY002]|uniref:helix-turn-helix domain-containing protein n=1 Tax=Maribacter luteocoastalis TaxID=3407671 RepID=UPI003B671B91